MHSSAWVYGGCVALVLAACPQPFEPGETMTGSSTSAGPTTGEPTTGMTTGGPGIQTVTSVSQTEASTGSGSSTGGDPCAAAVAALADLLAPGQPCEVLVHLGEGMVPEQVSVACGTTGMTWPSGKDASSATQCCESPTLYGPDEGPIFLMHQPGDPGPDGVAIVSNHTGRVVFDALTAEGSPGPITTPGTWLDAGALAVGMGCGAPGISLVDAVSVDVATAAEVSPTDRAALAVAIEGTALASALAQAATPVRSAVLRYSPQEGGPAHDFVLLEVDGN